MVTKADVARASRPLSRERPAPVGARAGCPRPSGRDGRATQRTRHPPWTAVAAATAFAFGSCGQGARGGGRKAVAAATAVQGASRQLPMKTRAK